MKPKHPLRNSNSRLSKVRSCLVMTIALLLLFLRGYAPLFAQNDLDLKVMMGYQGWFNAAGDGSAPNEWRHWFRNQTNPAGNQLNIDLWPEMTEYTQQYTTNMAYSNGTPAKLFSSHDASTTNVHFKWMRDYNIYGVYLQRFLGEIGDPRFFQMRNNVLQNVINASATYGRHFSVMYDISGVLDDGNLYNKLVQDWEYLINTYNMTNKPGYVKQNGLPVIAIWGIGFNNRGLKPETFEAMINYFHNTAAPQYRAYIVGGVPGQWRTLDGDSETEPRWRNIYHSLDMISPWAVGRYGDNPGADNWKNQRIIPDIADCNSVGKAYMPVIFPGFSWYNMNIEKPERDRYPLNQIPRRGGDFYWHQAYNALSAGSKFVYVAMFDEVDEGTAMFKVAPTKASTPAGTSFVTLDIDGQTLPSDWYLRLANETQKMLDKTIPLSPAIPIAPGTVAVTGVNVSPTSVAVAVNSTQQLTATVAPANASNKNVGWFSSNTAIATVSATGLVSGKAAGTATITVTTQDGTKTATTSITVTSVGTVPRYRIRNRWQNTYLYDAGDWVRYTVTASGTAYQWVVEDVSGVKELKNVATGEYMHIENEYGYVQCTPRTSGWSSSRWTLEEISSGVIQFKNVWKPNQYIHIENLQNQAQYGSINQTWTSAQWILEPVTTARLATEQMTHVSVILSPNPVSQGLINVQTTELSGEVNVTIRDVQGNAIFSGKKQVKSAALQVNIADFKAGTYIIQLQQGQKIIYKKFVVN